MIKKQATQPNPVDVHVGSRVRLRRTTLCMSQGALGELLGISYQQVQKYEGGANRISASCLFDLSRVLGVPVTYFFDEMPKDVAAASPAHLRGASEFSLPEQEQDPMSRRLTMELLHAFYGIKDPKVRNKIFNMIKAVAEGGELPPSTGVPES